MSPFSFAESIRKIATKKGLSVDDESLIAVQQNNLRCLCVPTKKCPCADITPNGCSCGLFVPNEGA